MRFALSVLYKLLITTVSQYIQPILDIQHGAANRCLCTGSHDSKRDFMATYSPINSP